MPLFQVLGTDICYVYDDKKFSRSPRISYDLDSLHGSSLMIGV